MRELLPEERMSWFLQGLADKATRHDWYVDLTEARHTWPRAGLTADHENGARLVAWASWRARRGRNGYGPRTFPLRKTHVWVSPPGLSDVRSPWFCLKDAQEPHDFLLDFTVPEGRRAHGWPPLYGDACQCKKIGWHGEEEASRVLANAQAAREAGVERRQERRYYQCPDDALLFHLTSKEKWDGP